MDVQHLAGRVRQQIRAKECSPASFREALDSVDPLFRDDWIDAVLGLEEVPPDADLPPGGVPYLPCPIDALLRVVDHAPLRRDDTFVDIGAGVGRAALAVHLLTGARVLAVEAQPQLVEAGKAAAAELGLEVDFLVADATEHTPQADVYFLYCPFDARRLGQWVDQLTVTETTRVATLDTALPPVEGLTRDATMWGDLRIYRAR